MNYGCKGRECNTPQWMRWVLIICGVCSFIFATWSIFWPQLWFQWSGMTGATYREMWMTVGMLNGVLGLGLLIASINPIRYWPNVLLAFLAKLFAPIGFSWAVMRDVFPLQAGWIIVFNELVWLCPLFLILWATVQAYAGRPPSRDEAYSIEDASKHFKLNDGRSLYEASEERPVALVFLRHFGCTFTRQVLKKLHILKSDAKDNGATIVLVHMLQRGQEHHYLDDQNVSRISDPYCELYRSFGLGKAGLFELFGPRVILRGIIALVKGCGVGNLAGDGLQLPGAFLIDNGTVVAEQKAQTAADLPKLDQLFS